MTESTETPLAVESIALPRAVGVPAVRLAPRLRWRLTQAVADALTVFAAAQFAYWAYLTLDLGQAHYLPEFYLRVDVILAALTVFSLHGTGAYRGQLGLLRIESVRRILKAAAVGPLLVLALSFFLQLPSFSRIHMLSSVPFVAVGLLIQRLALWKAQGAAREQAGRLTPVLIYGAGNTGRLLAQHLSGEHALGFTPVGFLDDEPTLRFEDVKAGPGVHGEKLPVLGSIDDLDAAIERTGARAVFIAMPSASTERIAELVARLESARVPFFGIPNSGNLLFSTLSFGQIGGMPVFTRRQVAWDPVYEALKRALDLVGAALLLVASSPFLLGGIVAVRLTSPGPVFFTQERVGAGGRRFTIWKLRTMRVDAPRYAEHPKAHGDPRITAVGRFLRRSCIDELPQLLNVLRGEMSLVGPRPEMPFLVDGYADIERQRLTVKPGVTGLWQISADRAFRIHDNMQYDLYYVENRGLSMDLAILLMTPFVMMARDRAV